MVAQVGTHTKQQCADVGWEGLLRNLTSTQTELGPDITSLTVKANMAQSDILHITITDLHDERWHVPASLFPESSVGALLHHPAVTLHATGHGLQAMHTMGWPIFAAPGKGVVGPTAVEHCSSLSLI